VTRAAATNRGPGDERPKVTNAAYNRRYDRLVELGFEPMPAHALAEAPVSLKQVTRLLARGCPHDVAVRILL